MKRDEKIEMMISDWVKGRRSDVLWLIRRLDRSELMRFTLAFHTSCGAAELEALLELVEREE